MGDKARACVAAALIGLLLAGCADEGPEARLRAIVGELRRLRLADDTTLVLIEDRRR
jgi:ferric-dicitrate binding protein FerR (iron transport regulator)